MSRINTTAANGTFGFFYDAFAGFYYGSYFCGDHS